MVTAQHNGAATRQPEMKYGPFAGGMSVAIWRNTVETDSGPRDVRSVTINPRRYRDEQSREWKDGSFRPSDISVLLLALQSAHDYMAKHPLAQSGAPDDDEPETPF
jgi:hypothetical protein